MRSIGYHFFEDSNIGLYKSSRSSDDKPLEVNCLGSFVTESPLSTFAPGGREDYYFLYIIEGELELSLPSGVRVLRSGDLTVISPGTPYKYRHTVKKMLNYFWIHFTGSDAERLLDELKISRYPNVHTIADDGSITPHFKKMLDAAAKQDKFKMNEVTLLFSSLLLYCARWLCPDENEKLKKSISYINQYYNTDIRIPELAKMENLSVSRYNTVFKQVMGISPVSYITKIRLTFACELLRGTNLSVKEIAFAVGYEDSHFFSRVFKASIGASPKEFRKNN